MVGVWALWLDSLMLQTSPIFVAVNGEIGNRHPLLERNVAPNSDPLKVAQTLLADVQRIVFFTGAGMSAESGIPPFVMRSRGCGSASTPSNWRHLRAFCMTRYLFGVGTNGDACAHCKRYPTQAILRSLRLLHGVEAATQRQR